MSSSLSDDNELQVQGVLRFTKLKREQHVREITSIVEDYKDRRIHRNSIYNTDDVETFFDEIKAELTDTATKEVENAYHTSALLVQVLLSQAQESGCQLSIDTNLLENEMLLKQMKVSEAAAISRPASDFARKAGQLNKIGTVATVNVADPQVVKERDALKEEVKAMNERLEKIQTQTNTMMKDKNEQLAQLRSQLEAKQAEVASAQAASKAAAVTPTPAAAPAVDGAMIAEYKTQLTSLAAQLEKLRKEKGDLQSQLNSKNSEMASTQDALNGKLNESKQFVTMKKMMQTKSQEVVVLKRRLAKYEPDGVPQDEEDNKQVEKDFDDDD